MKKTSLCTMLLGFWFLAVSMAAYAAPQIIGFQGRLTDDLGNPINVSTNMKFILTDD